MVKPTILNVDDYEPARYARTKMLRDWGFDVKEARTGAEALRLATLEHPALVILDIHLPDIDGFEVCRRLKRDHDGAALPILHISATFTSGAHQALGLEGGADGYLEPEGLVGTAGDRKSTRLNSSHGYISYAVFCLK